MRRRSPTSCLVGEQPIDRRVNEGIIADVIELRLHFLPIVRGHQRELLVQSIQRRPGCVLPVP